MHNDLQQIMREHIYEKIHNQYEDYTNCIKAGVWIQVEVTEELRKEAQMEFLEEYVAVVFYEMRK